MKASYHGHRFEVDSVIGKDGMEYPAQDVVHVEPDWSSFRREAAKDILAGMMAHPKVSYGEFTAESLCRNAILFADELIKQLKEK